jgi:hypothetical protein
MTMDAKRTSTSLLLLRAPALIEKKSAYQNYRKYFLDGPWSYIGKD